MQGVAYALHVEPESVDQQVQVSDYYHHHVVARLAQQQEVLEVLVIDAVPLTHHSIVHNLLLFTRLATPPFRKEFLKRFERFLQILLLRWFEQLVDEEVLEAAVAVHAYGLFAQFGEGKFWVEERVSYAGCHFGCLRKRC